MSKNDHTTIEIAEEKSIPSVTENIEITPDGEVIVHNFHEFYGPFYLPDDNTFDMFSEENVEQIKEMENELQEYVDNFIEEDKFDEDNFCGFRGTVTYYFPEDKPSNYPNKKNLDNKEYKPVENFQDYIETNNLEGEEYVKIMPVIAHRGNDEYIDSYDSENHYETTTFASSSDWVIYNFLEPENKWVLSDDVFKQKYEKLNRDAYVPIFTVIAYKLPENIIYERNNQKYRFLKGGYLLKDLITGEIHGCSKSDFRYTYEPAKNLNQFNMNNSK